jgi:hypothetical protein
MGEYVHSKQARFDKFELYLNFAFVSCGVLELHHLPDTTPSQTMFSVLTALYHKANPRPSAFVIFSDVVDIGGLAKSRGEMFAAHLTKHPAVDAVMNLWSSNKEVNPKTGNTIRLWVWRLDHEKLRKFYQDELANRVSEE